MPPKNASVRVRFAPSPTGTLHVGGARTAIFNYLFAQKHQGTMILRIEDTDQERHQELSIKTFIESLNWLGVTWKEGLLLKNSQIISKGPFAPYRQSERTSIYREKAEELLKKELAYYCFLKEEDIEVIKKEQKAKGQPHRILSPYRHLKTKEALKKIQNGESACIRFKTPENKKNHSVNDLVRGHVQFPSDMAGDFILIRSDGHPVYNFCCAIDDGLMKISHVFRAEEHLPNTLKQIMIADALNLPIPQFGHLSLILGEDKKKLSKRSGAESVSHFKNEGYSPEVLINFLSLLGWNPGTEQEKFTKEELIEQFSVPRINSSPAIFDISKLNWLQSEFMKNMSPEVILKKSEPFLKTKLRSKEWGIKAIQMLQSNFKNFKNAAETLELLLNQNVTQCPEAINPILKWPHSKKIIQSWKDFLEVTSGEFISESALKQFQKNTQTLFKIKGKELFMPLRICIIGKPEGVEIKILIQLISKKDLIERTGQVLNLY